MLMLTDAQRVRNSQMEIKLTQEDSLKHTLYVLYMLNA